MTPGARPRWLVPAGSLVPGGWLILSGWLVLGTAATASVVRYDLRIVLAYTAVAIGLACLQVRRWHPGPPSRWAVAAALVAVAAVIELVPFFSYVQPDARAWIRHGGALAALLAAAAWLSPHRRDRALALAAAVVGYLAGAVALIRLDPAPRIDVWVMLQQSADAMARAESPYTQTWTGSPGIQDAFTYLPWTAVLTAPGRWLAGDVRWALVVFTLAGAAMAVALGRGGSSAQRSAGNTGAQRSAGMAVAVLLLLTPGIQTQVEQAWTEPVLFACVAAWALAVSRDRAWWAVVPLALGCASKQHLVLLLPVLAAWPGFGLSRAAATGVLAGLLVLPWFVASPGEFWRDTVVLLVEFPPLRFADTLYVAARTELGWTPPFWVTGAVVLGAVALTALAVRRHDTDLAEVLRWLTLLLLVANLVNKQAFYNQFWLVAALLLLSLAAPADRGGLSPPAHRRAAVAV